MNILLKLFAKSGFTQSVVGFGVDWKLQLVFNALTALKDWLWRQYLKGCAHQVEKKNFPDLCPEPVGVWQRARAMKAEDMQRLERTERMMIRWMCGVKLSDRKASANC